MSDQGAGYRVLDTGCWVLVLTQIIFEYVQINQHQVPSSKHQVPGTQNLSCEFLRVLLFKHRL